MSIRLCAFHDLVPGTVSRHVFDAPDGRRIALAVVRIGDDLYGVDDLCSHAEVSLSDGIVWADDCELECPKHGSTFDLSTGEPQSLPATRAVTVWNLTREGDDVMVVPA